MTSIHIALLDADPISAQQYSAVLGNAGIVSARFDRPIALFRELRRTVFDAVLVADNLPDERATSVVQALRCTTTCHAPILVIGQEPSGVDLISAFDAGADDYIPADDADSLLPRLIGHHRRARRREGNDGNRIGAGPYQLDLDAHSARLGDEVIHLTPKEFALAKVMFSSPGVTLPRQYIETVVWGATLPPLSRALAAMVARLRRVLQLGPQHGVKLCVVHACGYRLDITQAEPAPQVM